MVALHRKDNGPRLVVGQVNDKNAKVWGRGDAAHPVMFLTATDRNGHSQEHAVTLTPKDGYTGVVALNSLSPSTDYRLMVSYGATADTPSEDRLWSKYGHLRTTPPPGVAEPFSMLLNSCNFHGWGPFRDNDKAVVKRGEVAQGVDLVLHAGDQVYADKGPINFTLDEYRGAYTKGWGDTATADLLANQANYMIPDDHEVTNGFALDGKLTRFQRFLLWAKGQGGPEKEQYEEMTNNAIQAFREFQRSHGPHTHGSEVNYYNFAHGQHQFFAMDTRMERDNGKGQIISDKQRDALFSWLQENREQPKFILTSSPFLLEAQHREDWSAPEFRHSKNEIIDFLAKEKIDNVVFLAGDIHASGHTQMIVEAPDGTELVLDELVSSPVNGTIQRSLDYFVPSLEGQTSSGTRYRTQLDEESFLGKGRLPSIANSNVMRIEVDGNKVRYQTYRTRRDDDGPARQGAFEI